MSDGMFLFSFFMNYIIKASVFTMCVLFEAQLRNQVL